MKKSKHLFLSLAVLIAVPTFAFAEGVAAGGGGGDQTATIRMEGAEVILVTCPGLGESVCTSGDCMIAVKTGDTFERGLMLKNICDGLESK